MKTTLYIAEAIGNHQLHYHQQEFFDIAPSFGQIAEAANFPVVDWTLRYLGSVPYTIFDGEKYVSDDILRRAYNDPECEIIRPWQDKKRADAVVRKLVKQALCFHDRNKIRLVRGGHAIVCDGCDCAWKKHDTKEFFVRFGKDIVNHTKIGWVEILVLYEKQLVQAVAVDTAALDVLSQPVN